MNLKIKEFNCEKAGFRAIHTENGADMFILWSCIINGATEFSMHQWNFLSWHCLELKSINLCHFKGFLWLSRSWDIDFLWNRFLQVVSFSMKQQRQKVWKFTNCTLKFSCRQKQWRNFVWVDDFLLFLGADYLPVWIIC